MAIWKQEIALAPPPELQPAIDALNDLQNTANSANDAAQKAADAAVLLLAAQAAPVAVAAQLLVQQLRDLVQDTFSAGGYQIMAHPFQFGVGKGEGIMRNLSFPNLIDVFVRKLNDQGDSNRPTFSESTQLEAIAFCGGGPSPSLFQNVLQSLNTLLGVKEFHHALRRINQALEQEQNRLVRKSGAQLPYWKSWQLRHIKPMAEVEKQLLAQLAMLEGYAVAAQASVAETSALITKKAAQLQRLMNDINTAMALLNAAASGSGFFSLFVTGAGTKGLQTEIKNATGGAGHELSFCAGNLIVAPAPVLSTLKTMAQL